MGLKAKTMAVMVITSILPLILLTAVAVNLGQDAIRQSVLDTSLSASKTSAGLLNETFSVSGALLQVIAGNAIKDDIALNDTDRLQTIVSETYNASELFEAVWVLDKKGTCIASYPRPQFIGKVFTGRDYYNATLASKRQYVSNAFLDPEINKPVIYVSTPVPDNGDVIGMLVVQVELSKLGGIVGKVDGQGTQRVFIVDSLGRIVYHPDGTMIGSSLLEHDAVKAVIQGMTGTMRIRDPSSGEDQLVAYAPVKRVNWGVVVSWPASEAYGAINSLLIYSGLALLAMLGASALIAYFVSGYIADPIARVTDAARSLPEGRLIAPLKPGGIDELKDLIGTFNNMYHSIREAEIKQKKSKDEALFYLDLLSHDIVNIDQAAMSSLELAIELEKDSNVQALQKESLEAMLRSASLVKNVKALEKIMRTPIHTFVIDIDGSIDEAIREESTLASLKGIRIEHKKSGLKASGNEYISKAIGCGLNNAIRFSPQGSLVKVSSSYDDRAGFCCITIEDPGQGMTDAQKDSAFEQVLPGSGEHRRGTGFYLIKKAVDACGGTVKLEDIVPGQHDKGLKVSICLRQPLY